MFDREPNEAFKSWTPKGKHTKSLQRQPGEDNTDPIAGDGQRTYERAVARGSARASENQSFSPNPNTEYDNAIGSLRSGEESAGRQQEDSFSDKDQDDSQVMKNLRSKEDDSSANQSPDESNPTTAGAGVGAATGAASALTSGSSKADKNAAENEIGYNVGGKGGKHARPQKHGIERLLSNSGSKKKLLGLAAFAGVGGFLLVIAILLVILFSFVGTLKVVHFATILRSAGFARFQFYMQEQYGKTIFDAATLTDSSTGVGSKSLGDRSLFQKLTRVNPQARLIELGDQGTLKFDFQGTKTWGGLKTKNTFKGVEVNGQSIQLDDLSQGLFNKDYADLNLVERLRIQAKFISEVNDAGLSQALAEEGLAFRSSVYNGLRQLAGIRMYKWVSDQLNKYANGTTNQDDADDIDQTMSYVEGDSSTLGGAASELESEAQQASQESQTDAIASAEGAGTPQINPLNQFRSKLADKLEVADNISTAAFIVTVVCIAHSLGNSIQQAEQQDETEGLRMAHDAQTTSDQIQQGNSDFNAQEVGADSARWNNAEYSPFYKQDTGQALTASDYAEAGEVPNIQGASSVVKGIGNVLNEVSTAAVTGILSVVWPGAAKTITTDVCNVLLNQFVQYGIAGVEVVLAFLSGGTSEGVAFSIKAALLAAFWASAIGAGTIGVGQLLGSFIDKAVSTLANVDYNGSATGPLLFSEDSVTTDELQQGGTRPIAFGAPISNQVAADQQTEAMNTQQQENSQEPFSQRYFAINNPYSLIGNIAAVMPASFTDLLSSARNGLASLANLFEPLNLFNTIGSILSPKAMAASNQTILTGAQFGVQEWGWTNQELNAIETDPSYTWQANANFVEPQYQALYNEYMPCYQPAIQYQIPSQCTQSFLTTPTALHWRAYMSEAYDADHLAPGNTDQ